MGYTVVVNICRNNNVFPKTTHVAFVGQKGTPAEFVGTGGVEFYVEERAVKLVCCGHTVDCFVRSWATSTTQRVYKGIRLVHVPTIRTKHLDATVYALLASVSVALSPSIAVVWYQCAGPAMFSWIPKLCGKRIITTIHALDWKRKKWNTAAKVCLRLAEKIAVHTADTLLVVSHDIGAYIRRTYNKPSVLDCPKQKRQRPVRLHQFIPHTVLKKNKYVLYMGRFVPEKRIEWLISAFTLSQTNKHMLVLAGGAQYDGAYEKRLRKTAQGNPNILFPGYVFGKNKQELLSNCLALILPSSLEGAPYILYEASAYNRTIVVSEAIKNTLPTRLKRNVIGFNETYAAFQRALEKIVQTEKT